MTFDVKDFYPSITEILLVNALNFAKQFVTIKKKDFETIMHARKSLLYSENVPWMKKSSGIFDVTMGAFDGAEVCELVGIFLLSQLVETCSKENIGLYRDDGLAVFENISGPQAEKIKKKFQKVFNDNGLQITILCNLKIVDFLDATFNLNDGSYKPYRKPDDEVSYIDSRSNHPPNIVKQLPMSIEDRLRELSSSKAIFEEAAKYYQGVLDKAGYTHKLAYEKNIPEGIRNRSNRKRGRKITWFNPPYSKSVSTNVAGLFLKLIDKHFPPQHRFRKIFNRNNLKVSYSCMPNVKKIVNGHNKKVLAEDNTAERNKCNCPRNSTCPLNGACLSENTLYAGKLSSDLPNYNPRDYAGVSEGPWKQRWYVHRLSFNDRNYANCRLAKEVWRIKDLGGDFHIEWRIIGHAPAYNPIARKCSLCTIEKLYIAEHINENLLNKRDELVSKCRHRRKYSLEICQ